MISTAVRTSLPSSKQCVDKNLFVAGPKYESYRKWGVSCVWKYMKRNNFLKLFSPFLGAVII